MRPLMADAGGEYANTWLKPSRSVTESAKLSVMKGMRARSETSVADRLNDDSHDPAMAETSASSSRSRSTAVAASSAEPPAS